jgi:hypothetical protein
MIRRSHTDKARTIRCAVLSRLTPVCVRWRSVQAFERAAGTGRSGDPAESRKTGLEPARPLATALRSMVCHAVAELEVVVENPWRAQGESNPCFRRERATSWTARRWARRRMARRGEGLAAMWPPKLGAVLAGKNRADKRNLPGRVEKDGPSDCRRRPIVASLCGSTNDDAGEIGAARRTGADGATTPETLRQKDRIEGRSGERRFTAPTEGDRRLATSRG